MNDLDSPRVGKHSVPFDGTPEEAAHHLMNLASDKPWVLRVEVQEHDTTHLHFQCLRGLNRKFRLVVVYDPSKSPKGWVDDFIWFVGEYGVIPRVETRSLENCG